MSANPLTLTVHKPKFQGTNLAFGYSFKGENFITTFDLPQALPAQPDGYIIKLLDWLAVASSFGLFNVEYYGQINCEFPLTKAETDFFEKLLYFGLGEFRYVNKIPIDSKTTVRGNGNQSEAYAQTPARQVNPLLLNGGGKDGSVSALLLADAGINATWFQRGSSAAQRSVVSAWNMPDITIKRTLDPNRRGRKFGGHRPINASLALISVLFACLANYDSVIASNEASANEGNMVIDGFTLNHQYSKSLEFETDFSTLLKEFNIPVKYFSLLRPLHELQIAVIAANLPAEKLGAITSCNNGTGTGQWCLNCAKCAFVALVMTAAGSEAAAKVWGRQVICEPALRQHLLELLDPDVPKPLDCVGTLHECQITAQVILNNKSIELDEPTRQLLAKYATGSRQEIREFIENLEPQAIPENYQPVIPVMKRYLQQWLETQGYLK